MNHWQPFNAVINNITVINEILKEKNVIKMPTLSDDKIKELENKINYSYNNQDIISIIFFKNGKLYKKRGIVTNISKVNHKIQLKDGFKIYFSQITEIY